MKYFIDFEFHERFEKPLFGKRRHIIEPISIGIVGEDGRQYYAIFKDFDFRAARNNDFLREKVLSNLDEFTRMYWNNSDNTAKQAMYYIKERINLVGKSKPQIAEEIRKFINPSTDVIGAPIVHNKPMFYGYYCDYDWVTFCSLFGRMLDLPKGWPMYCIDLKQELDRIASSQDWLQIDWVEFKVIEHADIRKKWDQSPEINVPERKKSRFEATKTKPTRKWIKDWPIDSKLQLIKCQKNYPKQDGEHNAIADARWNFELYKFLLGGQKNKKAK